ncbi:hypothetical protein OF83DRAFT_625111 [Amylostereum chailletii]|nr:hypothetical protein OF83DRAFT_625111 [Amylostereum chailletii]
MTKSRTRSLVPLPSPAPAHRPPPALPPAANDLPHRRRPLPLRPHRLPASTAFTSSPTHCPPTNPPAPPPLRTTRKLPRRTVLSSPPSSMPLFRSRRADPEESKIKHTCLNIQGREGQTQIRVASRAPAGQVSTYDIGGERACANYKLPVAPRWRRLPVVQSARGFSRIFADSWAVEVLRRLARTNTRIYKAHATGYVSVGSREGFPKATQGGRRASWTVRTKSRSDRGLALKCDWEVGVANGERRGEGKPRGVS